MVPATPVTPPPSPRPLLVEIDAPHPDRVEQAEAVVRAAVETGTDQVVIGAGSGPRARLGAVDTALHLRQVLGVDATATVTTWDRTIMSLQADLLGAHALGLRRLLAETGSPPLMGDYPQVDGVWEVDSIGLVELLTALNAGTDRNVLLTRPVYERDALARLRDRIGETSVPLLATVRPLRDFAEAEYLRHEVPDVVVADHVLGVLRRAGRDAPRAALELAVALAADLDDLSDGLVLALPDDPGAADRLLAAVRTDNSCKDHDTLT